jgi:hypothetical protein
MLEGDFSPWLACFIGVSVAFREPAFPGFRSTVETGVTMWDSPTNAAADW